jgi:hypothetical protein
MIKWAKTTDSTRLAPTYVQRTFVTLRTCIFCLWLLAVAIFCSGSRDIPFQQQVSFDRGKVPPFGQIPEHDAELAFNFLLLKLDIAH